MLEFQKNALTEIARLAMQKQAGARALRSVMEEYLMDIMYEIPDMEGLEQVIITKETITKGGSPIYKSKINRRSA